MTGRDFCAAEGLSEPNFYAWRREIARRDQERTAEPPHVPETDAVVPAFLQVALDTRVAAPPAIEIVLSRGRLLRVAPGFDADHLRQLVRLLEEPAC